MTLEASLFVADSGCQTGFPRRTLRPRSEFALADFTNKLANSSGLLPRWVLLLFVL